MYKSQITQNVPKLAFFLFVTQALPQKMRSFFSFFFDFLFFLSIKTFIEIEEHKMRICYGESRHPNVFHSNAQTDLPVWAQYMGNKRMEVERWVNYVLARVPHVLMRYNEQLYNVLWLSLSQFDIFDTQQGQTKLVL